MRTTLISDACAFLLMLCSSVCLGRDEPGVAVYAILLAIFVRLTAMQTILEERAP